MRPDVSGDAPYSQSLRDLPAGRGDDQLLCQSLEATIAPWDADGADYGGSIGRAQKK
jgi:hypothetical protein